MTWINARYAGRCRCGSRIILGDIINHDRRARAVVACRSCKPGGGYAPEPCAHCEAHPAGTACANVQCPGRRATGSTRVGRATELHTECPNCAFDIPAHEKHLPCGSCGERATESEKAAADDRALFQSMEMDGFV
jgi:ribosomal protein S27AE